MTSLLLHLNEAKKRLKKSETKGGVVNVREMLESEPNPNQGDITRNYFFEAALEKWYSNLESYTFRSAFVPILTEESCFIINNWKTLASLTDQPTPLLPQEMIDLSRRIDAVIESNFSSSTGVFVKLSTRSPKDSKTVLKKASEAYRARLDESNNIPNASTAQHNAKLIALSEEMLKANAVRNGREAVSILLDSWRVAEDLMYAVEEGKDEVPMTLVIRAWDSRITPQCEFRGFVWDRKLNCVGQYWHSLFYPELEAVKETVAADCLAFFEKIKDSLPVPNAMLDLAWLGPGNVLLIEVNPLMEGLGSFRGSTGLFDYYADEDVLTGKNPFEIRLRTEEEDMPSLISHMSMEWRSIAFGF